MNIFCFWCGNQPDPTMNYKVEIKLSQDWAKVLRQSAKEDKYFVYKIKNSKEHTLVVQMSPEVAEALIDEKAFEYLRSENARAKKI